MGLSPCTWHAVKNDFIFFNIRKADFFFCWPFNLFSFSSTGRSWAVLPTERLPIPHSWQFSNYPSLSGFFLCIRDPVWQAHWTRGCWLDKFLREGVTPAFAGTRTRVLYSLGSTAFFFFPATVGKLQWHFTGEVFWYLPPHQISPLGCLNWLFALTAAQASQKQRNFFFFVPWRKYGAF